MTLVQDNSVQAINTALLSIKRDVSSLTATTAGTTAGLEPGKTYNINISGNAETATTAKTARTATNANHAETAETATKMPNALTVNGKTYNGSEAVDAGVQAVANGGTGATTAKDAFMNLANGLSEYSGPLDTEHIIFQNENRKNWGLYTLSQFWEYIKSKISSVLGLTKDNYGGKASTAGTADKATSDANGNNIVNTYATKTELEKTTTKSASLSTVTTGTTKYIKLGTFRWYDSFSFMCRIAGNSFEDNVNINILGGISSASSVCGYYSTNSRLTKSIIVKRGEAWNSDFEIYLKITQLTTADVYVTIDKYVQDRINISESTTAPSGTLEEIVFNNINGMFSSNIDAKCIKASGKMIIPIGAPASLEDGCIWIER